jgi:hypothetical protein
MRLGDPLDAIVSIALLVVLFIAGWAAVGLLFGIAIRVAKWVIGA